MAGDRLGPGLEPLAIRMAVRAGGRDVGLTANEVAAAFPHATPRRAVFVHGLAAAWPEQVQEILLAGHSMGGLVIRSACHYGREASVGWAAIRGLLRPGT